MINGAKVICLSGSTRFTQQMLKLSWELAKERVVALGWCVLPISDGEADHHLAEAQGCVDALNEVHLRKIDLSDELWVVNVNGYFGEDTKREIEYAKSVGKPVKFLFGELNELQKT